MKKESGHGGRREGAGRKPIEGEPLKPTSIALTDAQREKLKRLGGGPWVRKKIDAAKE